MLLITFEAVMVRGDPVLMAGSPEVAREGVQPWEADWGWGIHHVNLMAHDVRETAAFFHEIAGMQELYNPDGIHPRMDRMVIIGHSMGGLLTELQVKDSGSVFWPAGHPEPDQLRLEAHQAQTLSDCVFFEAVPQIERAIFIATPHRGSDIAVSRVGDILSQLISLPTDLTSAAWSLAKLDPFFAKELGIEDHIPNSVDDLRPDSEFIAAVRSLPFKEELPVHSIVALGPKPLTGPVSERNDGLVSYSSAHLEEAVSEKTVLSGHRAPNHPEAISEVVRILRLHLER